MANKSQGDVRQQLFVRLPGTIQPFLTWLTGKPHTEERARPSSSLRELGSTATQFAVAASLFTAFWLSPARFSVAAFLLLALYWTVVVGAMRKLQVVIYHHCAHGTVLRTKRANAVLGEAISVVLLIKRFSVYRQDHMKHHHREVLLTDDDETQDFLFRFAGLRPGLSKQTLWKKLKLGIVTPSLHGRWLRDRFLSCFNGGSAKRNFVAAVYWSCLILVVGIFQIWDAFFLAWLIPLTVFYQVSATLRLAAEHRWPPSASGERDIQFVCRSTVAVFCGSAPPETRGRLLPWLDWGFRMVGHLLARTLVLVGDTPCHDYHHRRPGSRNWPDYIFARQHDADAGCPGFPENYYEVWGLLTAIELNLQSLSEMAVCTDLSRADVHVLQEA
jgi:fatty acid desaturase